MNQPLPSRQPRVDCGETLMTIGKMAESCGVTVRTLRYYEELDLIAPVQRGANRYRLYNEWAMKRVRAIQSLQDLGYSLEAIQQVLGPYSQSVACSKADRIATTRDSLEMQRSFVREKLTVLNQFQTELDRQLTIVDTICTPCYSEHPEENCSDHCEYRSVHL